MFRISTLFVNDSSTRNVHARGEVQNFKNIVSNCIQRLSKSLEDYSPNLWHKSKKIERKILKEPKNSPKEIIGLSIILVSSYFFYFLCQYSNIPQSSFIRTILLALQQRSSDPSFPFSRKYCIVKQAYHKTLFVTKPKGISFLPFRNNY